MRTTEEFIKLANNVHQNKYNYNETNYISSTKKVEIICPEHGTFFQEANSHLMGKGCAKCATTSKGLTNKENKRAKIVDNFKKIHGDKYDYSQVDYIGSKTNVKIICSEHGEFLQSPNSHLKGRGCPECGRIRTADSHRSVHENVLGVFTEVHSNKYDYSKTIYKHDKEKIIIICLKHGEFLQTPHSHLKGRGCKACANELLPTYRLLNQQEILDRFIQQHGNRYDYSQVEYTGVGNKVVIRCQKHGEFTQLTNDHLQGHGCPSCFYHDSKAERELYEWVKELSPDAERRNTSVLGRKELDIYIPSKKFAIEFNGLYYHSDNPKFAKNPKLRHKEKSDLCATIGIHLFHVFEDDWEYRKDVVKHTVAHLLNTTNTRIYARKTTIKQLKLNEVEEFFNAHHMQGTPKQGTPFALYYDNDLVACMVFSKPSSERGNTEVGRVELLRYACKYSVVGGASKLFKHFCSITNPKSVVSYSDDSMFTGNMYQMLGFSKVSKVSPDYKVVYKGQRVHKSNFRLARLAKLLGDRFDPTLSERENCHNNNLWRVYNAGLTKWEYTPT